MWFGFHAQFRCFAVWLRRIQRRRLPWFRVPDPLFGLTGGPGHPPGQLLRTVHMHTLQGQPHDRPVRVAHWYWGKPLAAALVITVRSIETLVLHTLH